MLHLFPAPATYTVSGPQRQVQHINQYMMGLAGAHSDNLPSVEDFDYSRSHRTVPVPRASQAHNTTTRGAQYNHPDRIVEGGAVGSVISEERSRSFGFRKKGSQHLLKDSITSPTASVHAYGASQATSAYGHTPSQAPAVQTHAAPSVTPQVYSGHENHESPVSPSSSSTTSNQARTHMFGRKTSGEGGMMMRKGSSKLRAEQERRLRQQEQEEAASYQRQAPHLPVLDPIQSIGTFGGEDSRPDSVAIFNHQYTTDPAQYQRQQLPHRPSQPNFSRPGVTAMPSSNLNSSSSPSYAIRQGNAFAQAAAPSSSPSVSGRSANGDSAAGSGQRGESMTNRGRYSYASNAAPASVNSPRRVRRRKDPTPFNALVIGAKNSGKTSFINFLKHSLAVPDHKPEKLEETPARPLKSSFTKHFIEAEMDGERIGVTLWDSAGLEKHIIDLQLREMASFVESKFEETFMEEQKVMRSPGAKDTHIHCVFFILDPVKLDSTIAGSTDHKHGGINLANASGLDDDLDLQVMRALWGKTTVIPIISKADTLTTGHMTFLKRAVWDSLKEAKLDPLEALELEDDGDEEDEDQDDEDDSELSDASSGAHHNGTDDLDDAHSANGSDDAPLPKSKKSNNNNHNRHSSLAATAAANATASDELPYLPMSILSPDPYDLPPYAKPSKQASAQSIGRRFPWGLASPYDPSHCDFTRLRDSIFSEWRGELRDLARTKWYENWRTSRLKNIPGTRQRLRGGVTPVGSVPKEGRGIVRDSGSRDGAVSSLSQVPRSVAEDGSLTHSQRVLSQGTSDGQQSGNGGRVGGSGGTYRGVETYQ